MAEKNKPFSKAIAVGTVLNKSVEHFPERDGKPGREYLQFDVRATENSRALRVRVQNSEREPMKVKEVDEYIKNGDFVKVDGRLDYRNNNGREYYTEIAYTVEKVDPNTNKPRTVFVLLGEVAGKEMDGGETCTFSIVHRNSYNGQEYITSYPLITRGEASADIGMQIEDGFVIMVVGQITQTLIKDDYDMIIGSTTELEVKELKSIISAGELSMDEPPF